MTNKKFAIIGGGNLGSAIADGLVKSEAIQNENIIVTRRKIHLIGHLKEKGVKVMTDNVAAVKEADLVFLVVKPYQLTDILKEIKPVLKPEMILVSMVTGVSLKTIEAVVGDRNPLFRAMPNTAVALCESLTCLAYDKKWEAYKDEISDIFDLLGKSVIITEELMASATVLGSCGIAFALRFMRAAMQGGIEIGFSADVAQFITAQTMKGACELILQSNHHPEEEIDKVTTPRGITISGLNEMEHQGFSSSLIQGITSSFHKIDKQEK
ncbi:MAG: pyrroline-5-carboxylate reductase [Bacteroidota bacterium]|nr:pyrroline-5-carboxylate reductase [Bacteroidota bacterium]